MCDKTAYREWGYKPRRNEPPLDPSKMDLYNASPMNPGNRKRKTSTGTDFIEDHIR